MKVLLNVINPELHKNIEFLCSSKLDEYKGRTSVISEIINQLINIPRVRNKMVFLEFLEISQHSFNEETKPKEGYILKQSKILRQGSCLKALCCCKRWQRRWFLLKDDLICYLDSSSSNIGKDVNTLI